jgi:hypothetical protein
MKDEQHYNTTIHVVFFQRSTVTTFLASTTSDCHCTRRRQESFFLELPQDPPFRDSSILARTSKSRAMSKGDKKARRGRSQKTQHGGSQRRITRVNIARAKYIYLLSQRVHERKLADHNTRVPGWMVTVGRRCSRAELRREEDRRIGEKNRVGRL